MVRWIIAILCYPPEHWPWVTYKSEFLLFYLKNDEYPFRFWLKSMRLLFASLLNITFHSERHWLSQSVTFERKNKNLSIGSAESSSWWNVKELCIDAAFFLLIWLSNRFVTKNFLSEIKCCISSCWWGCIARQSCWEAWQINIQKWRQLFSIFLLWKFCAQIALELLIKWTSH